MDEAGDRRWGRRMDSTESREEYLEAVFKLECGPGGATITRIARELGVQPASVSQMITRLVDSGLLHRDSARGQIGLTDEGRTQAVRVVRRHRLSERFLTDYLGLPWDTVHEEACRLEHALSDAAEESLARRLGHPATCPHGHPIPYEVPVADCGVPSHLADARAGESWSVAFLADESPEFLRYAASCGLAPGVLLVVVDVAPFDGPMTFVIESTRYQIGREAARRVAVTR